MGQLARRATRIGLRVTAMVLLTGLAAAGFLAVTVKVMFPPERLKEVLTHQLQLALQGRPVQVDHAEVVLFKGVRVTGLRVLDIPYLGGQKFITSEEFTASLRVLPLLRKRLSLGVIRLEKPVINVVRFRNGSFNISDLLEPGAGVGSSPELAFSADRLEIVGGELRYDDRVVGLSNRLEDLDFRFNGVSAREPFGFELAFRDHHELRGVKIAGRHALSGQAMLAGFDLEQAWVKDVKLRSDVEGKRLDATIAVRNFRAPELDLEAKLPAFDATGLGEFFGIPEGVLVRPTQWKLSLAFPDAQTLRVKSLHGAMNSIQVRASGSIDLGQKPAVFTFQAKTNSFEAKDLTQIWQGLAPFKLGGRFQWDVEAQGPAKELDFKRYAISSSGGALTVRNLEFSGLDAKVTARGGGRVVEAKIAGGAAKFDENEYSNFDMEGKLEGDRLDVGKFDLAWNGAPLRSRFVVQNVRTRRKRLSLEADLTRLDIRKTLALTDSIRKFLGKKKADTSHTLWWLHGFKYAVLPKGMPSVAGRLKIGQISDPNFSGRDVRMVWSLDGFQRGMSRLKGDVRVEFGPGRILDIPRIRTMASGFRILFLPFAFLDDFKKRSFWKVGSELTNLDYKLIHGEYLFDAGVMKIRNFFVDGDPISATASGEVDWGGESVDTHVLIRDNSPGGLLPKLFMTPDGRAVLSFFVKGEMEAPELSVDFKRVPAGAVEKVIESGRTIKF